MAYDPSSNNPMNVRASHIAWLGETTPAGAAFESFDTLEHGVRAGMKCLLAAVRLHGCDTLAKVTARYAPAKDRNDPVAYARFLAKNLGVSATACIDGQALDPTFLAKWAYWVAVMETGTRLAADLLAQAARDALGLE